MLECELQRQRKFPVEPRKAREAQEATTEIDMTKYAPPSIQQAYADARANRLLCEANADEKRAELELTQVTAKQEMLR